MQFNLYYWSLSYDINSEFVDVTEHSDSKAVKLLRLPQESWIVKSKASSSL